MTGYGYHETQRSNTVYSMVSDQASIQNKLIRLLVGV